MNVSEYAQGSDHWVDNCPDIYLPGSPPVQLMCWIVAYLLEERVILTTKTGKNTRTETYPNDFQLDFQVVQAGHAGVTSLGNRGLAHTSKRLMYTSHFS